MRDRQASLTAAWVATCRGLAGILPPGEAIRDDPWGLKFGGLGAQALALSARQTPRTTWRTVRLLRPVAYTLCWVQLRTRVIDDLLLRFVGAGGRQMVLLGAGYDARATRLEDRLRGVRVFEVDHPATQARKRRLLGGAAAPSGPRYLAWDFEHDPMPALPERLAALGHDPRRPTFTLWEGVTMYLSERAIAETVSAVRAASAPGSRFVFEYLTRGSVAHRSGLEGLVGDLVTGLDEPFRFGWEPAALPAWLAARGFALEQDDSDAALAHRFLPRDREADFREACAGWEFHLAVASPAAAAPRQ